MAPKSQKSKKIAGIDYPYIPQNKYEKLGFIIKRFESLKLELKVVGFSMLKGKERDKIWRTKSFNEILRVLKKHLEPLIYEDLKTVSQIRNKWKTAEKLPDKKIRDLILKLNHMKLKRNVEDYDVFYLTSSAFSVIYIAFTNNSKIGKDYLSAIGVELRNPIYYEVELK